MMLRIDLSKKRSVSFVTSGIVNRTGDSMWRIFNLSHRL